MIQVVKLSNDKDPLYNYILLEEIYAGRLRKIADKTKQKNNCVKQQQSIIQAVQDSQSQSSEPKKRGRPSKAVTALKEKQKKGQKALEKSHLIQEQSNDSDHDDCDEFVFGFYRYFYNSFHRLNL